MRQGIVDFFVYGLSFLVLGLLAVPINTLARTVAAVLLLCVLTMTHNAHAAERSERKIKHFDLEYSRKEWCEILSGLIYHKAEAIEEAVRAGASKKDAESGVNASWAAGWSSCRDAAWYGQNFTCRGRTHTGEFWRTMAYEIFHHPKSTLDSLRGQGVSDDEIKKIFADVRYCIGRE